MDLGASVAFVAEPAAPSAMRRPRPPGARFLGRAELAAITGAGILTATALAGIAGRQLALPGGSSPPPGSRHPARPPQRRRHAHHTPQRPRPPGVPGHRGFTRLRQ